MWSLRAHSTLSRPDSKQVKRCIHCVLHCDKCEGSFLGRGRLRRKKGRELAIGSVQQSISRGNRMYVESVAWGGEKGGGAEEVVGRPVIRALQGRGEDPRLRSQILL